MRISETFGSFPQLIGNLKQQVLSGSKKSSEYTTTASNIKFFREANKGELAQGLLPGFYDNIWIDQIEIPNIKINMKDQIVVGATIYEIIGVLLYDSSDEIEPFWQLLAERKTTA